MSVKWAEYFDLIGLALNVFGTAVIFLFAYPSQDETRRSFQIGLTRLAIMLMFCGFLLQTIAAYRHL